MSGLVQLARTLQPAIRMYRCFQCSWCHSLRNTWSCVTQFLPDSRPSSRKIRHHGSKSAPTLIQTFGNPIHQITQTSRCRFSTAVGSTGKKTNLKMQKTSPDLDQEPVPLIAQLLAEDLPDTSTVSSPHSDGGRGELSTLDENLDELESLLDSSIMIPVVTRVDDHNLGSNDRPSTNKSECREEEDQLQDSGEVYDVYGGPDASVPLSSVPCSGCGAKLHCQDPGIPGYMPSQKFLAIPKKQLRDHVCQRCHLLRRHCVAVNVSLKPEEYRQTISHVRDVQALVLLLVDVMDCPNSLFKGLPELIGKKRPVYVIGNKVDLLPKDDTGYLQRVKEMLQTMCVREGLSSQMYIQHIALVSAKTGYGVEQLITKLMKDWSRKGHVYLLGCTNVGKSTLFNALLSSDYCKENAREFIHRATISRWPGTTLDLLKFPVINPTAWRLHRRTERLLKERTDAAEENILQRTKKQAALTGASPHRTLVGHIGQTFTGAQSQALDEAAMSGFSGASYSFSPKTATLCEGAADLETFQQSTLRGTGLAEYKEYAYRDAHWCYDTPGVINEEQIINLLTQEELSMLLSNMTVNPRTFLVKPSSVLFMTGLGRIDYLQGNTSIYLTVFCSGSIPIHIVPALDADDIYTQNLGTKYFKVPLGERERLEKLPALVGKEMSLHGLGWRESMADILMSSIGWVAVTAGTGMEVTLRAYTPGGRGCRLRTPSLLKYAVNLRGSRVGKTPEFKLRGRAKL